MPFLQLNFNNVTAANQEILIAALSSIAFDSFQQNDNNLQAFIEETLFNRPLLNETLNTFNQSELIGQYQLSKLEDKNWNKLWESNFPPVVIAKRLLIKAPFHNITESYEYVIELEPKMAFGTGHHETTSMVLEAMLDIPFQHKAVLDFGCGTGILAIFAAMKGATDIDAVDNDEWAYKNSKQNIEQTGFNQINIQKGTLQLVVKKKYDIILANINKNVIKNTLAQLYDMLQKNGQLIISGILREDEHETTTVGLKHFTQQPEIKYKGNWSMIAFKRT